MYVKYIKVKNFRLLRDMELNLDKKTTLIVGRNNSGKTSLTELFRRLLTKDEAPRFRLEDFSLGVLEQFWEARKLRKAEAKEEEIRKALPAIGVVMTVDYKDNEAPSATSSLILTLHALRPGSTSRMRLKTEKFQPYWMTYHRTGLPSSRN